MKIHISTVLPILLLIYSSTTAWAANPSVKDEVDRIAHMDIPALTEESLALLEEKYPAEDWESHDFPNFVYTSDAVEAGYRIAVKEPELLRAVPCYCFCEAMGHKNLLHCFLKEGATGGRYDDHAVGCNICYGQAMLAFLWKNAGLGEQEILDRMEKRFESLVRQREQKTDH